VDTIYNSTFADSDIDIERANVLKELEVNVITVLHFLLANVIICKLID